MMIIHSCSTQCQVPIGTGFKSAFRYSGCAGSPDLFIFIRCFYVRNIFYEAKISMIEVAGIEQSTPNRLQIYEIISFY